MNVFFTSDNHFFHKNVIGYCKRPFLEVEEMNEKMILNWNTVVMPDDMVYHLGDFSMAARPVETITKRLNGIKILINGNHDFTHPFHKKSRHLENQQKWIDQYKEWGWTAVHNELIQEFNGIKFRMCHLPYTNDKFHGPGDKYDRFRPIDDGTVLLCGHVHEK